MPLVDSIIGGASGILGSYLNYKAQMQTNAANAELAKNAQNYEREMWNEQNKYNSPTQQIERLKQAGLNPNLVYGSGTVSGNNAGQAPKATVPAYESPLGKLDVGQVMNTFLSLAEMKQKQTQTALMNDQLMNNLNYWKAGLLENQGYLAKQKMAYEAERSQNWPLLIKQEALQKELQTATMQEQLQNWKLKNEQLPILTEINRNLSRYNTPENMWLRFAIETGSKMLNLDLVKGNFNLKGRNNTNTSTINKNVNVNKTVTLQKR